MNIKHAYISEGGFRNISSLSLSLSKQNKLGEGEILSKGGDLNE